MKIFRQAIQLLVPGYQAGGRGRWTLQHVRRSLGPRVSGPLSVAARGKPGSGSGSGAAPAAAPAAAQSPPPPPPTCPRLPRAVVLMLAGFVSICTGVVIMAVDPYTLIRDSKVKLTDGGETFQLWQKPPVDLFLKVWLFNITNSEAFLNGEDEKLQVEEVGPYVYRELLEHADVTFNDNGTLTARPKNPLVWDPSVNTLREDDVLILPNIALLSISHVLKDTSYFTRLGMSLLVKQTDSQPLVPTTAHEFMFGYESPLTTLGNKMLPSWIFFDKIGLIDRMYDFTGDTMVVHTGEDDVRKSGSIDRYRGLHYVPEWPENCSMVKGASDASKFPSLITPQDQLVMYRKSLCRSMPMMYTGEKEIGGLNGYVYTWKDGIFDNGLRDPHNKCYCRHDHCLPEGLLDAADCYYGFPIALSYPHFYKTDPVVMNYTDGCTPVKEKHETVFVIEPESGLTMNTAVRMQINMALGDLSRMHRVQRFSNMVLPMLWLEISCEKLPDSLQNRFYLYLRIAPMFLQILLYGSLIGGPLLLVASILRVFWKTLCGKEESDDDTQFSRKHMNYIQGDRRSSLKAKEMDTYFTSLLMPPTIDEERKTMLKNVKSQDLGDNNNDDDDDDNDDDETV